MPSTTVRPIALPALALTPQVVVERGLRVVVAIDMLVNPFRANQDSLRRAQPATDLFQTPLFLEETSDAVLGLASNASLGFDAAPVEREAVSLLWAISAHPLIPPHFTANGVFVDTNLTELLSCTYKLNSRY